MVGVEAQVGSTSTSGSKSIRMPWRQDIAQSMELDHALAPRHPNTLKKASRQRLT